MSGKPGEVCAHSGNIPAAYPLLTHTSPRFVPPIVRPRIDATLSETQGGVYVSCVGNPGCKSAFTLGR